MLQLQDGGGVLQLPEWVKCGSYQRGVNAVATRVGWILQLPEWGECCSYKGAVKTAATRMGECGSYKVR